MLYTSRWFKLLSVALMLAGWHLSSCKKETSTTNNVQLFAEVTSSSDAEAEAIFDNLFDNVMGVDTEVGIGGTGIFGGTNPSTGFGQEMLSGTNGTDTARCFTVTYTQLNPPNRFPLKVVMDFGAGCTGRDGRTRKGKIISIYTGPLFIPENYSTTTFDGYYVGETKVEGTHKVINKSTQASRIFRTIVLGAKLTKPTGNYTEWNSEKTITQVEGLGTPLFPLDDIFTIVGGANGAVKKDDNYFEWATAIREPLVKKFTCRWLVKGILAMKKSNTELAVLDYGDGTCDNKAVITVGGASREINLQ